MKLIGKSSPFMEVRRLSSCSQDQRRRGPDLKMATQIIFVRGGICALITVAVATSLGISPILGKRENMALLAVRGTSCWL